MSADLFGCSCCDDLLILGEFPAECADTVGEGFLFCMCPAAGVGDDRGGWCHGDGRRCYDLRRG